MFLEEITFAFLSAKELYSLAGHTLLSLRERGSGEHAYNELFCWNAMIAFLITFRGARSAPHFRAASRLILVRMSASWHKRSTTRPKV